MVDDFDVEQIQDLAGAKQAILRLFNLVEALASENRQLREEKQQLRDEIKRLKGEQGQPQFKAGKKPASWVHPGTLFSFPLLFEKIRKSLPKTSYYLCS